MVSFFNKHIFVQNFIFNDTKLTKKYDSNIFIFEKFGCKSPIRLLQFFGIQDFFMHEILVRKNNPLFDNPIFNRKH